MIGFGRNIKNMHTMIVVKGYLPDYERQIIKRIPRFEAADFLHADDLPSTKVDHLDLVIYIDRSPVAYQCNMLNPDFVAHATCMSHKGIQTRILQWVAGQPHCRVWQGNPQCLVEIDRKLPITAYGNDGRRLNPREFPNLQKTINWSTFEKKFLPSES
jgi:hypothetical protein